MRTTVIAAIDKAAQICGGVAKLAQELNISQGAVSNWKARGSEIDPVHCAAIERATAGVVTRRDLRPDWAQIWPELAAQPIQSASEVA